MKGQFTVTREILWDVEQLERILRVHWSDRNASNEEWLRNTATLIHRLLRESNEVAQHSSSD